MADAEEPAVPPAETKEEELYDAALRGDVGHLKVLLGAGADPRARTAEGRGRDWTCPHIAAAANGNTEAAAVLFASGADVAAETNACQGRRGRRATHWKGTDALTAAAIGGHLAVVEVIFEQRVLRRKVTVEVNGEDACITLRSKLLEQLGSGGAVKPAPLMLAAVMGKLAVVQRLLQEGASVSTTKNHLLTALKCAVIGRHPDIAMLLLEHGAAPEAADRKGSDAGPPLDSYDGVFAIEPALHTAAKTGCAETVRRLLERGARIDLRGRGDFRSGGTALMAAARFGHADIAERILEAAAAAKNLDSTLADLNHTYGEGPSALTLAAEYGRLDAAKLLLDAGAPYRVADNNEGYDYEGVTTALLRCVQGQCEARYQAKRREDARKGQDKYGLSSGLDGHWERMTDDFRRSHPGVLTPPRFRGGDQEYMALIGMLCDHDGGKMLDMADEFGQSALIVAASAGRCDVAELILDKLGAINPARAHAHLNGVYTGVGNCGEGDCACSAGGSGGSALARAAARGHTTMAKMLLARGAAVQDPVDPDGLAAASSALELAAKHGHIDIALELLESGADTEAQGKQGATTALYSAVEGTQYPSEVKLDMLELLMEFGADPNHQIALEGWTHFGNTPLNMTAKKNETEIVRRLLSYGVDWMQTADHKRASHWGQDTQVCKDCTARDFAAIANGRDSKEGTKSTDHMAFMDAVWGMPNPEDFSPARFAIESRHHRELRAGLRHCHITFEPNDRRGMRLAAAASVVASWPGAPPVCSTTAAVAEAVQKVARAGWKKDSPWSPINHWLQPRHVKVLAQTVLLCHLRAKAKNSRTLLDTPPEIWHLVLAHALGRDTLKPEGMPLPRFEFRVKPPLEQTDK